MDDHNKRFIMSACFKLTGIGHIVLPNLKSLKRALELGFDVQVFDFTE